MTTANAHVFGTQETEEYGERGILERIQPKDTFKVFSDKVNITLIGRSDLFERLWGAVYWAPADNRNRYHQAAKLRHIETGVELLVMNTHFSNGSSWANIRTRHAKKLIADLGKLTLDGTITADTPVILMGDFNDKRRANEPGPAQEFKAAGLIDPRDVIGWPNVIDRIYTRNCTMRAVSRINTPITVSDHDWWTLTADIGLGAPKPPPDLPVTMYVRPVGDPIWKDEPFEIKSRGADGEFQTGDAARIRQPGFKIVGRVVELKLPDGTVDQFVRTASGRCYRLSYLTTEAPS